MTREEAIKLLKQMIKDGEGFLSDNTIEAEKMGLKALENKGEDRPKGRWIGIENEEMEIIGYYCSECDLPMETKEQTKFCPNCGARMKGSE